MLSKPTITTTTLLAALSPEQSADKWTALVTKNQINWTDLVIRSIAFGLAPLLHERVTAWQVNVPAKDLAKLALTRKANRARNEAINRQLAEILAGSAANNLRPIALKGVHLANHWYSDPSLRPMNDIDLLFAEQDMDAVDRVLTDLGYKSKWKSAELGAGVTKHTSTYRRDSQAPATPNPFVSAGGDRTIEPHTSLEESWFGLRVDITPGMRARAHALPFGAQTGWALDNEDLLLHLCIHLCFHLIMGAPSMVQLADFVVVLESDRINWQQFVSRAETAQAAPYAWAALQLAKNLLGIVDSAENTANSLTAALARLQRQTSSSLQQYINGLTVSGILQRTQKKPLITVRQRIVRGFQDRAETARWAPDWQSRLRVWRSAFDVANSDTGRLILRRA